MAIVLPPRPQVPVYSRKRKHESDLIINPEFNLVEFAIEEHVKSLGIKLDTDRQLCKEFLSPEGCKKGADCPKRHSTPSSRNFRPPSPPPYSAHARTVCKHWLRGLCKKGQACEFMHEYNLRKMPECWFFAQHGYCNAGDECMYLHVSPAQRRPECRAYVKGFCPEGPRCPHKHIRRVACPLFLAGFCPRGHDCDFAHPPFELAEIKRLLDPEYIKARRQKQQGLGNKINAFPEDNNGGDRGGGGPGRRRDLSEVLCFKCGVKGHYASACPNPMVPGQRGGVERGPGGRQRGQGQGGHQ